MTQVAEAPELQIAEEQALAERRQFELAALDFIRSYNNLAAIIYADNVKKGFWPKKPQDRNVGEALMLAVSEIAEAMEGHRKNLPDDHLPAYQMVEVEPADCIIRLMDLGHGFKWRVAEALVEKLLYNRTRPFKHGKNY